MKTRICRKSHLHLLTVKSTLVEFSPVAHEPGVRREEMSTQLESLLSREARTACARQDLNIAQSREQQERERAAAEALLAKLFAGAVQRGDVAAPALFARRRPSTGAVRTVAAVIEDALGNREAFMARAMRILVNAANGKGTQRDAQQLLEEAGAVWAENEADFA